MMRLRKEGRLPTASVAVSRKQLASENKGPGFNDPASNTK